MRRENLTQDKLDQVTIGEYGWIMKRENNTKRWSRFCNLWLSIGNCAVVDANRAVSRAGHLATTAALGLEVSP